MGYSFWELYFGKRMPNIRWRAGPAEIYYKETKSYHLWDPMRMRKEFLLKRVGLPVGIVLVSIGAFYLNLKGQGMLHVLHKGRDGVKEYYNHTLGRHIDSHYKDERALRQREAYRKALEKREEKIMEQYRHFEEAEIAANAAAVASVEAAES